VRRKPRDHREKVERAVVDKNFELRARGVLDVMVADDPDLDEKPVSQARAAALTARCARGGARSRTMHIKRSPCICGISIRLGIHACAPPGFGSICSVSPTAPPPLAIF
jgi:hypothetical protein